MTKFLQLTTLTSVQRVQTLVQTLQLLTLNHDRPVVVVVVVIVIVVVSGVAVVVGARAFISPKSSGQDSP